MSKPVARAPYTRDGGLIVIGPTPPPAHGVSVTTTYMLRALRSLGLLRAHLETRDERPLTNIGRLDFINVWLALKQAVGLVRLLRASPASDVYLPISQGRWGIFRDALFAALGRLSRRKIYIHLHGGALHQVRAQARWPLRTAIDVTVGRAEQVWVLTPGLRSAVDGIVQPDQIRVIENVVPDGLRKHIDRAVPTARAEHTDGRKLAGRDVRILFLSQLSASKGCFTLLDALALLGKEAISWHLRFVGYPRPERTRSDLLRRVQDLRSGTTVEVLGPADQQRKWEHYAWADLFVLPTFYPYEGQPLVLLEALAAGLPVVSTRHAGIPETVRNGQEGLLVPANEPVALAAAIQRLAVDDELRNALARAARKRYETRYVPSRLEADLHDVLTAAADAAVAHG